MRPAAFLDRDGTVIEDAGYGCDPDRVEPFPWSPEAIRLLRDAGFAVVIVTNQSGVARGLFDEACVRAAHRRLDERLRKQGAAVDGYYYCPHHPEAVVAAYRLACGCRKPAPGLVHAAARDLGLDVARSFVVGDKWLDVGLAANAGATGVLVRTGPARGVWTGAPPDVRPAIVVDTLVDAARWILAQTRTPAGEPR